MARPSHPQATTVLVLGILGVTACNLAAPFAWVIGRRTLREIDAAGGWLGGRESAQIGYVLGIIGSVLLGFAVLALVVMMGIWGSVAAGTIFSS